MSIRPSIRFALVVPLLVLSSPAGAHAQSEDPFPAPTPSRDAEPPRPVCRSRVRLAIGDARCDTIVMPLDIVAGGGVQSAGKAAGTFSLGFDVLDVSYRSLGWTVLAMRLLFSQPHASGGISGDFFVGTSPRYRIPLDRKHRFHIDAGVGVGWGSIAHDAERRDPSASGVVLAPNLRFTWEGRVGLELMGFVPAYDGGERRAFGLALGIVGTPIILLLPTFALGR